jgi:hypothetical protein
MPMSYTLDPSARLIRAVGAGVLTDEDVMEHRRTIAADPRITSQMREISDVRNVTDFQVTVAGIRIMIATDVKMRTSGGMRRLAVVAEDNVAYGMSRMYQTLGEPNIRSVGVFRDYKEAEDWLATA